MNIENKNYIRSLFLKNGEKLKFKMGQSLSDDNYLSGSVYFIENGSARVIYKVENKFKTICKIGSGSCVGAVSLIRSSACENIRASTELLTYKISDQVFINLFENDSKFKEFFKSCIFDAEVINFLDFYSGNIPEQENSLFQLYKELRNSFNTYFYKYDEVLEKLKSSQKNIYLGEKINGINLYSLVNNEKIVSSIFNNFDDQKKIRFISIKSDSNKQNYKESLNQINSEDLKKVGDINSNIKNAPPKAPLSVFNNSEISEDILVKANGVVRETLACFQMISRVLKIPIRKDSIEKILRDCENRGAEIDLRLIGELLSNLGLNVTSGEIPSRMASRLQTPCVIKWRESFAIVLKNFAKCCKIYKMMPNFKNCS